MIQEGDAVVNRNDLLDALKAVEDPELMINIVDLGLVYRVERVDDRVEVDFTLTTSGCPAGDDIRRRIVETLREAAGVPVVATLVWSPPWGPARMSDEAKIALGYPI